MESQHIVAKPIISQVICDKLYVTYKVDENYYKEVYSNFDELVDAGYAKTAYASVYKRSLRLDVNNNDMSCLVQCYPHDPKNAFFRTEFNPTKIGPSGMSELRKYFDLILPKGFVGIVLGGVCTRTDTAIDIFNLSIDQVLFRYSGMRLSKAYYSKDSTVESYYIGGDKGKSPLINAYDKVKQVKKYNEKHPLNPLTVPSSPTVRLEIRHRERRPLSELPTLPNLFKKLEVFMYHNIEPGDWVFNQFLTVARHEGLTKALFGVPNNGTRKLYRKRVKEASAGYWQPDEHWKNWKDVAGQILNLPIIPK